MKSKWFHLKPEATKLRKNGYSLPDISKRLGIPKSTLSGWLRDIKLTKKQQERLHKNWQEGLVTARKKAVIWHNTQKARRLQTAKEEALRSLKKVDTTDLAILELTLAILYLAEGSKKNIETALGSSDPATLRFFLYGLEKIFSLNPRTVRCELYLRADQDPDVLKSYWAHELRLPLDNFKQINVDKRSQGKNTYDSYKGVCSLRCGNVAIRRRLMYLAEEYFAIIVQQE